MRSTEQLLDELGVSRETIDQLVCFENLIRKWNPTINLVSKASVAHLWARHIIDSIQVFRAAPKTDLWLDFGSGGGFPGLIAAIMAAHEAPETRFVLIESDTRKSAFLRSAARETGIFSEVIPERVESVPPQNAGVVSARAVADLSTLLGHAYRHMRIGGSAVFPKGESWQKELDAAQKKWRFRFDAIPSITEPKAVILKIEEVSLV